MMFKAHLLLIPLFFLSNCNTPSNKNAESLIVGEWTNCERKYSDGTTMVGNTCIKILFKQDHSGINIDGMGGKHKFTWTLNANTIIYKNDPNATYHLYKNGSYITSSQILKTGKGIIMYHVADKVRYYLNR